MSTEFITVKIGQLPGAIQEVALNGGRTVNDALTGAGLSADGFEIRVNSSAASFETTLSDGDLVLLVKKIKGN